MRVKKTIPATAVSILAISAGTTAAKASDEAPARVAVLAPIEVSERDIPRVPAPIDVRHAEEFADNYANDPGDALFFAPGVIVNALDVNEPRIVLRGFGLANRQERSTVPVFRDGAPLTDVHGATNSTEIDLLAVSKVEVMRGGGGDLRFVGDNLGGAVNFVSPRGRDIGNQWTARADSGASVEGDPGGMAHTEIAGVSSGGGLDYYASVTGLYENGLRDNNQRNSAIFNGNLGYRFSRTFSTRVFVEVVRAEAELAGGLTPEEFAADPTGPMAPITLGPLFPGGPIIQLTDGARTDDFARDVTTARVSNQTKFQLLGHDFNAGFHIAKRKVESPQIGFVGVLDEEGDEWGVHLAISRLTKLFGIDTTYRAGAGYAVGDKSSDRFENLNGAKGDQLVDTNHRSANLNAFLEVVMKPFKRLVVDIGAKFIIVDRELTNEDDDPEEAQFTGVSARGGVTYRLRDNFQIFANAHRTYEPPSFSELISDDPTEFNDLGEQDGFTYEAGFRGALGERLRWDLTYFHADIEGEIINLDDPETNGIGETLVNADKTTHKGFELGLDLDLFPSLAARSGGSLTWRSAYSFNDFTFTDGDPIDDVDGNRLAGAPQHLYRGELRYDDDGDWFAALNVQIAAGDFYADHQNETAVPTYAVLGFSAGYQLNEQIEIYASGENILDNEFVAGVTPVLSQATQGARGFTPGRRASLYGGLRYQF